MPTAQFAALAADRKRRLRVLRRGRLTRPVAAALSALLTGYAWLVIAAATLLAVGPLAAVALVGAVAGMMRGRA